jgi:pyridinium-3,5-biscarboxylic acid mononucleotide sulfurtransferase
MSSELITQRDRLLAILAELPGVAVAFSGGIDSTVVAKAAVLALGNKSVAVTADSPSVPRSELATARDIAAIIGIRHVVIATAEFDNPDYLKNGGDRCYHCKSELYSRIEALLPELGAAVIASGANLDDRGDYRPGLTAAAEHRVRHPLQEAGFRHGTSRRRPVSPAGSRQGWPSRRSERGAWKRPRRGCGRWVCASAGCVIMRAISLASRCRWVK